MKSIINWTVGSFFRTIGKFFALLFIGLIILLIFGKFNIKALQLIDHGDYNYDIPSNCKSFYFYAKFGNSYLVCSSDNSYLVEQPFYNTGLGNPVYFKNYRVNISQSLYENWLDWVNSNTGNGYTGTNPLIFNGDSGIGYYDNISNKYYAFYSNPDSSSMRRYLITYNEDLTTTLTSVGGTLPFYGSIPYASNINMYLYVNDGLNQPQRVCYSPYKLKQFSVTFHLNGGTSIYNQGVGDYGPEPIRSGTYSLMFYDKTELDRYLSMLSVKNDIATFNHWYYDEQLTQLYNPNNDITSNIDLYASYIYTSVDSIISNVDFNEFTFPSDYQYAVISIKQDFSQGLYIGLGFNFQYLDVYNYDIQNQVFTNGSLLTLSSIGSKNNYYYYHLSQIDEDSSQVIVLDKSNLTRLGVDNVIEHYYTFRLSSNSYIEFTNDLTQVSYYIPTGNGNSQKLENQDISSNYDYTQKFILDSNSDIVTMFLNLIKNGDFTIFNMFKSIWYKFRAYKVLNYFLVLSIGALIVALIKGGSRH